MLNSKIISILVFEYKRVEKAKNSVIDPCLQDFADTSLANLEGALREVVPHHEVDGLLGLDIPQKQSTRICA